MNGAKRHGPLLILQAERAKDRDGRTSVHSGADGAPGPKFCLVSSRTLSEPPAGCERPLRSGWEPLPSVFYLLFPPSSDIIKFTVFVERRERMPQNCLVPRLMVGAPSSGRGRTRVSSRLRRAGRQRGRRGGVGTGRP